jgi:hypothetical protein
MADPQLWQPPRPSDGVRGRRSGDHPACGAEKSGTVRDLNPFIDLFGEAEVIRGNDEVVQCESSRRARRNSKNSIPSAVAVASSAGCAPSPTRSRLFSERENRSAGRTPPPNGRFPNGLNAENGAAQPARPGRRSSPHSFRPAIHSQAPADKDMCRDKVLLSTPGECVDRLHASCWPCWDLPNPIFRANRLDVIEMGSRGKILRQVVQRHGKAAVHLPCQAIVAPAAGTGGTCSFHKCKLATRSPELKRTLSGRTRSRSR